MKGKIRNTILLLLIFTTLYFSKDIWTVDFYKVKEATGNKKTDHSGYQDLVRPYKALINFNNRRSTIVYRKDKLWDQSKGYIRSAFIDRNAHIEHIDMEEYETYLENRSLVFHFPEKVNTYLLLKSLDVPKSNGIIDKLSSVEYIYLNLSGKEDFIVAKQDDEYYKISNISFDDKGLLKEIKEIEGKDYTNYYSANMSMDIDSLIYVSYNMAEKYPYIKIEKEVKNYVDYARKNSERFFLRDIEYIKEVFEDNKSILHIYNQQVLKYSKYGRVDYFNPLQEAVSERNLELSLNKILDFLKEDGISLENLYLSNIKDISYKDNLGYRFAFRYSFGDLDLLDMDKDTEYLYLDVYNSFIQSYRKNNLQRVEEIYPDKEGVASFRLLNEYYDIFKEDYLKLNKVDLKLVGEDKLSKMVYESFEDIGTYYITVDGDEDYFLKPAWLFRSKNMEYIFDYYSGELLYKNKLDS